jgi:hypothetical protein
VITLLDHLNIDRAAVLHRISMGGLTGLASDRLPERFYGWPLRPTPWRALAIRPAAVAGAGGTPGRNGGGGRRGGGPLVHSGVSPEGTGGGGGTVIN